MREADQGALPVHDFDAIGGTEFCQRRRHYRGKDDVPCEEGASIAGCTAAAALTLLLSAGAAA